MTNNHFVSHKQFWEPIQEEIINKPVIVEFPLKPRGPLSGKTSDIKQMKDGTFKIKCPLESSEGKTFKAWADYHPIAKDRLYHIPNGGSRNMLEAKNLKAQGVKCGVSDYFLSFPHNGKHGLYIELKRRSKSVSRLTEDQAVWLAASERLGYSTKVAYGAEEAIRAVEEYLK